MFPGIARDVTRGLLTSSNGFTVRPWQRSVRTLGELFQQEGGEQISERAPDETDTA